MATAIYDWITGNYHTSQQVRERLERSICKPNGDSLNPQEMDVYFQLRDRLLTLEVQRGVIAREQIDQIEGFRVDNRHQIISYRLPGSGHLVEVPFEEVEDRSAKQALEGVYQIYGTSKRGEIPSIGALRGKRGVYLERPRQRKGDVLKGLPKTFEKTQRKVLTKAITNASSQEHGQTIANRAHFVELFLTQLQMRIDRRISAKHVELQRLDVLENRSDVRVRRHIGVLRSDILGLQKLEDRLKKIDPYALTIAATYHPIGHHFFHHIEGSASQAERQVTEHILSKKKGIFNRHPKLDRAEEAYAKGVGELISKPLRRRQTLEDLILHEAIAFTDGIEAEPQRFAASPLFNQLPPGALDDLRTSYEESHAIAREEIDRVHGQENEWNLSVDNQGNTDEQAIENALERQRNGINFSRNAPPYSGMFTRRNLGTAALGLGAMAAGGQALGLPVMEHVRGAVSYPWNYPWQSIKSLGRGVVNLSALGRLWYVLPSRELMAQLARSALVVGAIGGGLVYAEVIPSNILPEGIEALGNATTFIYNHPGAAIAIGQLVRSGAIGVHRFIYPEQVERTGLAPANRRKRSWKRMALGGLILGLSAAASSTIYPKVHPRTLLGLKGRIAQWAVWGRDTADWTFTNSLYIVLGSMFMRSEKSASLRRTFSYYTPSLIKRVAGKIFEALQTFSEASQVYQSARSLFHYSRETGSGPTVEEVL